MEAFFSPFYGFLILAIYFVSLLALSFYRSRSASLSDYFIGSRNSTWWLITLGMIGDSVSGVTFVSVPGSVASSHYAYFQIVLGYFLGYLVITYVLLPLYYQKNLISIYAYLGERFGVHAQKTASVLFIVSRTFGSAARLYISVMILHSVLLASFGIHPITSFAIAMALIVLYTYKGDIKTLVWTEAYQSLILLASIAILFVVLWNAVPNPLDTILAPQIFFTDPLQPNFFIKSIFGGMLITSAMNGLDQNIMQMNLSCKNIGDAQKNMLSLSWVMVVVNFIFLALGALAHGYYQFHQISIPSAADQSLPFLAFGPLGTVAASVFLLGLSAATFSSAGTILPAIASSIEIDLLPLRLKNKFPIRLIHALAAVLILFIIILIYFLNTRSMIDLVLRFSGYTYGPLIALYGLGIFTSVRLTSRRIPWVCALAIVATGLLDHYSATLLNGYQLGLELIAINALFALFFAYIFAWNKKRIGAFSFL